MNKKTIIMAAVLVLFIFGIAAMFAIKNKPKHAPQEGSYKTLNYVDGVSFQINSDIVNTATAVSEISENVDLKPTQYYAYKDGGNNYLLFNMDGLVVAAKKGTNFHFQDNKSQVEENLANSDIAGIWFEKNGNKITYEEQNGSYTVNVIGGLSITNQMYGDFIGKIRTITKDDTEYGIFVGVPYTDGTLYKKLNDNTIAGIEAIVNSFTLSDYVQPREEQTYEVVINEDSSKKEENNVSEDTAAIDIVDADTTEDSIEEIDNTPLPDLKEEPSDSTVEPTSSTEPEALESTATEEPQSTPSEEDSTSVTEEVLETPTESPVEPTEEQVSPTQVPESEQNINEEIPAIESPDEPEGNWDEASAEKRVDKFLNLNNQKPQVNRSADKAYTSDIYSMLDLKDNGLIVEYDYDNDTLCNVVINVERIYTGQSAIKLIKEYCDRSDTLLNYFEAPMGCSWHVAEYSLSYKNASTVPYINIKLKGMDGEILKENGIPYSKRTFDMLNDAEKNGDFITQCYVFYAVPNGWSEYCLECGTGAIDVPNDTNKAAYYKIRANKQR